MYGWVASFRGTFVLALQLIYFDQISRVFTRNIKDSLFYNEPENFASIDEVFSPWEAKIGMVIKISMSTDRKSKMFTPPQNMPLKKHFLDIFKPWS
jgi:hypothetical protein